MHNFENAFDLELQGEVLKYNRSHGLQMKSRKKISSYTQPNTICKWNVPKRQNSS